MGKKAAASRLLKALGKTKKEQMAKLYPKVKGDIRGKGPYLRGKVMGAGDLISRRAAISGVDATQALRKAKKGKGIAGVVGAGAAGYAVGKGWHKKLAGAVSGDRKKTTSHKGRAKQLADKAIKKQKDKKKRRTPHD
jgi:hypothetical protein